jgi:hypothetical protein
MSEATIGGDGCYVARMDGRVVIRIGGSPYRNYFFGEAGRDMVVGGGNIGAGFSALGAVEQGGGNIAFGDFALSQQLNLSHSIAIGYQTLRYATAASDCIGIGSESLKNMITGTGTTVIGRLGWSMIPEGGNNTGVGDSVGRYSVSGIGNCAMGYRSFESGNGDYNVMLGFAAALSRSIGNSNVGLGSGAFGGSGVSDLGDRNVGVGFDVGQSLRLGYDNIFLGANSGNNINQKSDVVNSIAIGADSYTTVDNQIVIGDSHHQEVIIAGVLFTRSELIALKALIS